MTIPDPLRDLRDAVIEAALHLRTVVYDETGRLSEIRERQHQAYQRLMDTTNALRDAMEATDAADS